MCVNSVPQWSHFDMPQLLYMERTPPHKVVPTPRSDNVTASTAALVTQHTTQGNTQNTLLIHSATHSIAHSIAALVTNWNGICGRSLAGGRQSNTQSIKIQYIYLETRLQGINPLSDKFEY